MCNNTYNVKLISINIKNINIETFNNNFDRCNICENTIKESNLYIINCIKKILCKKCFIYKFKKIIDIESYL